MYKTNIYLLGLILMIITAFATSCSKDINDEGNQNSNVSEDATDPDYEDTGINTPEEDLISFSSEVYKQGKDSSLKYGTIAHKNIVYNCAINLGLSEERAVIMEEASIMPDVYQAGISNAYNQQWSHAYIITETLWGMQWLWGDADDDFHDNLHGDSGESESPEGYNEKWAGYYYELDNQDLGDWYVGYACHYITDVSFVLHTTFPGINMALYHFDFEDWMDNNWTEGHNFSQIIENVPVSEYYSISDAKSAIRSAAKASNYSYSLNGQMAWDYYESSDFPTEAGEGSEELVYYTEQMVAEATRWTGGAIVYALDYYNAW